MSPIRHAWEAQPHRAALPFFCLMPSRSLPRLPPARSPRPNGQGYASPGPASKGMAARMGKPIRAAIGRLFGAGTAQADA
ncbi:hypothetical protein NTCA1_50040 [Novosphingobium sp. TCA1]|nr:hypothetical protein NTCA1_50040 [Novosphingobium sp. TCA1]